MIGKLRIIQIINELLGYSHSYFLTFSDKTVFYLNFRLMPISVSSLFLGTKGEEIAN